MTWTLIVLGALASLAWVGMHGLGVLSLLRAPGLPQRRAEAAVLPMLSVVVTACDEADTLEAAIGSLLAQDYPDLEIILVDDRSRDGTRGIVDRVAAGDSRVVPVHVTALPGGWLGKVNAMLEGYTRAGGAYVLFCDADVRFAPEALAAALTYALELRLDHLTLLPRFETRSLLHAALMQNFFVGYVRRSLGRDPLTSKTPFGFGAFNLVRRAAFESTPGFEWLRMEVLDDLALGAMMKAAGHRSAYAIATKQLRILWYASIADAVRGFGKNFFGGVAGYSYLVAAAMIPVSIWLGIGPFLVFLQTRVPGVWWAVAPALLALAAEAGVAARFGYPFLAGLLVPATHLVGAWAMLRSALACRLRDGIVWRGTFYPVEALRSGRRVGFP